MFKYYQFVFFIIGGEICYQYYVISWNMICCNMVGGFSNIDGRFEVMFYCQQFFDWIDNGNVVIMCF